MSSQLKTNLDALAAALTTALTGRVVTQNLVDFSQRSDAELLAGVVTLVHGGEEDFAEYIGREADLGTLKLKLVGQLRVAANAQPVAVQDAEATLVDQVKAFFQAVPPIIDEARLIAWHSSMQIEHPYGWVVFDVRVRMT